MRNLFWITILAIATSSCSLFQKPSMTQDQIDVMIAENQSLERQITDCTDAKNDLTAANAEIQSLRAQLTALQEASRGKFQVIVGAFKNPSYADEYSQLMKGKGFEGKIIAGPFSFDLVTYSSHESLPAALRALDEARMNIIPTAWVYISR